MFYTQHGFAQYIFLYICVEYIYTWQTFNKHKIENSICPLCNHTALFLT